MIYHLTTTTPDTVMEYNFSKVYSLLEMIRDLAIMQDNGVLVLYHWHLDDDGKCRFRDVAA